MKEKIENMDPENYYEMERSCVTIKRKCGRIWKNFNQFLIDAKVYETLQIVAQYLTSNPILLAICIGIVSIVAIPLLFFILFAVINVAFVFTSFIVIEVTVLTIGATVLCCVLFCVISTVTVTGLSFVCTYYIIYYILSVVRSIKMAGA